MRTGRPTAPVRAPGGRGCMTGPAGSPWRDLPEHFGKEAHLQALPQMGPFGHLRTGCGRAPDEFDLEYVFVDGTIVQAHQKAAGARGGPAGKASDAPGAA